MAPLAATAFVTRGWHRVAGGFDVMHSSCQKPPSRDAATKIGMNRRPASA